MPDQGARFSASKRLAFLGERAPVVIAEIGGNHGGDLELAKRMVDAAAYAAGKVVKFQTYVTKHWISGSEPSFNDFEREALTFDEFAELAEHCRRRGVIFISTPFDEESVDALDQLNVPAFKVASGDLTNTRLLRCVARKGRPILLSTGASLWEEIDIAVKTIQDASEAELVLMHCVAAYPTPDEDVNLLIIPEMQRRYELPVGFSDHTLGIDISLGAVAMGAQVIEKHFTTDRRLPGGDNEMSILPEELSRLIEGSRRIQVAIGEPERRVTGSELALRSAIRRSLVLNRDLKEGHILTEHDFLVLRPGTGIPASELDRVAGRSLRRPLKAYHVLDWDDLL